MSEYEGPMNGLSKEEWDAFERDMASMPPYEPTEDDLDAMYKDYQKSIQEDLAQKDDPVDMFQYVQERHLPFDEPAVKESFENWFPNKLGEIQEAYQQQKEVADMIGISQSYISRLEKRIIKRLRQDLERRF